MWSQYCLTLRPAANTEQKSDFPLEGQVSKNLLDACSIESKTDKNI